MPAQLPEPPLVWAAQPRRRGPERERPRQWARQWELRRLRGRRHRRRGVGGRRRTVTDDGQHCAHIHRVPLRYAYLRQDTGSRGGDLRVDLVGGDFEEQLVALHPISDLLEPFRDGSLGDGLTELGHRDVRHQPFSPLPVKASIASPKVSDKEGCGWMNWATSSTEASQLTAR